MIFMLCSVTSGFHNLQISYRYNLSLTHGKGLASGEHESSSAHTVRLHDSLENRITGLVRL